MDILSHCFISIIWGVEHVWQRWIIPCTTKWPPTTPLIYSAITLVLKPKNLNRAPRQLCSGPGMMIHVWTCYHTDLWVLCDWWTTSERVGSSQIPHHDLQPHPWHAQLLPWFLDPRAWIMALNSSVVVQWWWCMYGHGTPLFYEYYMRHASCMTGVNHPTDHNMTYNYTLGMLSCYPGFGREEHDQRASPLV